MSELVRAMLVASEKAGNIARLIRADTKLFSLLVQEKTGDEKSHRFFQDFKTLADVLIQESLRHDIATKACATKRFPIKILQHETNVNIVI